MNYKRKNQILLFAIIVVIIAICCFLFYGMPTSKEDANVEVESSFYEPVMINDSTMHMNITNASCIMVQIDEDMVIIGSHNVVTMNYDEYKHELLIVSPGHIVKELDLDTIFSKKVPDDCLFE